MTTAPAKPPTCLLSRRDLCSRLQLSARSVDRLIASRQLPGLRLGRRVVVRTSDLEKFIDHLPRR